MRASFRRCAWAVLLVQAALVPPALAASTSVMSISESIATAVGSVSDSIRRSSDSSSQRDKVAEGDHRILGITPVAGRPGLLRLHLLALPRDGERAEEWWLDVPERAVQQGALAAGQVVRASARPYGYEFARADDGTPFFLVLEDTWHRELTSRPVTL